MFSVCRPTPPPNVLVAYAVAFESCLACLTVVKASIKLLLAKSRHPNNFRLSTAPEPGSYEEPRPWRATRGEGIYIRAPALLASLRRATGCRLVSSVEFLRVLQIMPTERLM